MVRSLCPDLVTIHLSMPYIEGGSLLTKLAAMPRICKLVLSEQAANNVFMSRKLEALGATLCLSKRELGDHPQAFLKKVVKACEDLDSASASRGSVEITSDIVKRPGACGSACKKDPVMGVIGV